MTAASVLVTGAGSGIGRAAAERLGDAGWSVWVTDVDAGAAASVAAAIARRGGTAHAAACDVGDDDAIDDVVGRIHATGEPLRAVVVNAAVFPRRSIADTDVAITRQVMSVNVIGAIATVLATRPLLAAAGGGSVVLLTSGASGRTVARTAQQRGFALYGASKAALERWTLGVCDELADDRIVVHLLCPGGVVDTPGTAAVLAPEDRVDGVPAAVVATAVSRLCTSRDVRRTGGRHLATELG